MHLCFCLYVCICMRKNLDLCETAMYFRKYLVFVNYFVVGCILVEIYMSFDFGEEILIIKGVYQNGFYIYFCGFRHLVYYNLIVCLFFGSSFSHLVCYFGYFMEIQ